jgi:hypothetical protein
MDRSVTQCHNMLEGSGSREPPLLTPALWAGLLHLFGTGLAVLGWFVEEVSCLCSYQMDDVFGDHAGTCKQAGTRVKGQGVL